MRCAGFQKEQEVKKRKEMYGRFYVMRAFFRSLSDVDEFMNAIRYTNTVFNYKRKKWMILQHVALGIPTINQADYLNQALEVYKDTFYGRHIYIIDNGRQNINQTLSRK
jgi:hypothetical protein